MFGVWEEIFDLFFLGGVECGCYGYIVIVEICLVFEFVGVCFKNEWNCCE